MQYIYFDIIFDIIFDISTDSYLLWQKAYDQILLHTKFSHNFLTPWFY